MVVRTRAKDNATNISKFKEVRGNVFAGSQGRNVGKLGSFAKAGEKTNIILT